MSPPDARGVIDVDCHVLEPAALWALLDGVDHARVRDALWLEDGRFTLGGRKVPSSPGEFGATIEAASGEDVLSALDDRGVERAVLVPGWLLLGFPWVDDARAQIALARAYNEWAQALASSAPDRLLPVAVLPQGEPVAAAQEALRAAGAGFRAAWICPALDAGGGHPALPAARPLWRALLDADLAAYVHPPLWCPPELSERSHAGIAARLLASSGAGVAAAAAIGPPMDCSAFLMSILADGLLEELPGLRLIFAHSGTAWLPLALEKTESALWLCHQDRPVCLEPHTVFELGHHLVAFDALDGSVQRMGGRFSRIAAWGSASAPHPASRAEDALRESGVSEADLRAFMGHNAAAVLGARPG